MKFEKTTRANELPTAIMWLFKNSFRVTWFFFFFIMYLQRKMKNAHEHALDNFFLQTDLLL